MIQLLVKYSLVALLFVGSATFLFSCEEESEEDTSAQDETMMTEYSENLTVVKSQNGRKSYDFKTPLLEGYTLAKDPYREFRKGVKILTYKEDSLGVVKVDGSLTANYAIFYVNRDLWEAKGNVVAEASNGRTLYTQQLFWNAKTRRIYSNVDSKIVQNEGRDVMYGAGFESNEEMTDWRFRYMTGCLEMEMKITPDSTETTTVSAPARPAVAVGSGTSLSASTDATPRVVRDRPISKPVLHIEPKPTRR
ncbi:MAG: LPS export ABC transporter periplasmic protein LptC [Alistipes sp.]